MLVPSFTLGSSRDVTRQTRLRLTRLHQGCSWQEAMEDDLVALPDDDALLVIGGPARELASGYHAQLYLPLQEIARQSPTTGQGRFPSTFRERTFRAALTQPWSTAVLHGDLNGQAWLRFASRTPPFLEATLRFWDQLTQVGPRYTVGASWGQPLWATSRTLPMVLAAAGVPEDALRAPLAGSLQDLLDARDQGALRAR